MSTTHAFNQMLTNFLEELVEVFPEVPAIKAYASSLQTLVSANARKPMELFMAAASPHADAIMGRDNALFDSLELGNIDFKALWNSDISDNTRAAIWQYIHMLFLLGTTVSAMPPELLESIESIAQGCAEKMANDPNATMPDLSAMTSMLMGGGGGGLGGAGGLMSSLLGGGLGALGGGGGGNDTTEDLLKSLEAPTPRKQPKPATKKGGRRK